MADTNCRRWDKSIYSQKPALLLCVCVRFDICSLNLIISIMCLNANWTEETRPATNKQWLCSKLTNGKLLLFISVSVWEICNNSSKLTASWTQLHSPGLQTAPKREHFAPYIWDSASRFFFLPNFARATSKFNVGQSNDRSILSPWGSSSKHLSATQWKWEEMWTFDLQVELQCAALNYLLVLLKF